MIPLVAAGSIALLVWCVVAFRLRWLDAGRLWRIPLWATAVVVSGSLVGYEFWHRDIGPIPITFDRLMWAGMLLIFGVQFIQGRIDRKPIGLLDVAIALLLVVLTASTFAHDFRYHENLPLSRLLFFNWMPIGVYFVVRYCRVDSRDLRFLLLSLASLGLYLALTGIAEWRNWSVLVFPKYIMSPNVQEFLGRRRGPFLNPIVDGTFMIAGWLALMSFWPKASLWWCAVILMGSLVFLAGIYATLTRSVWISLFVCVGGTAWILASTRAKGVLVIGSAVAAAVVLVFLRGDLNSFKRDKYVTEEEMSESVSLRPLLAQVAWKMFLDKPLLGHGFGQYTAAKRLYHQQVTDEPLKKVLPYTQHNVLLSYLTETGAVGGSLLLAIWALFGWTAWKVFRDPNRDRPSRAMGVISLSVLLCYAINGMFHDVSIMPMFGSLYYLTMGLARNVANSPAAVASVQTLAFDTPSSNYRIAS